MSEISVTRRFSFPAAHFLPCHSGKCKNVHGHTYVLEVELSGPIIKEGSSSGMICDFKEFKQIVEETIVDLYDHCLLNDYYPLPTAELMCLDMFQQLKEKFKQAYMSVDVRRVRLYESENTYAEVK